MIDFIKNTVIGLLVTALISVGGYSYYLYTQVDSKSERISELEKTVEDKNGEISSHKQSLANASQIIVDFQKRFDDLKNQEAAKAEEIAKALGKSRRVSESYEKSASRLLATIPKSSNMCLEADDLINSYLRNERASK